MGSTRYQTLDLGIRIRCPKCGRNGKVIARVQYNRAYLYCRHGNRYHYLRSIPREKLESKLELLAILNKISEMVEVRVWIPKALYDRVVERGLDINEIVMKMIAYYLEKIYPHEEEVERHIKEVFK